MSLVLDNVGTLVQGTKHLADISLSLESGSFNTLLGPTGAGKTSLLRLMAGLDHPASGKVYAGGKDVTKLSVRKRSVAMVYQQFINYPGFTVFDNIASPLKVARTSFAETRRRVKEVAELLQLDGFLERMPNELSGGQQQRVALARALAKKADLVLLDEPLANLDYKLREELRKELPAILQADGATVVYASTDPEDALTFGGNVVLMQSGAMLQSGPVMDVYRQPDSLLAAKTMSDPPLNSTQVAKKGTRLLFGIAQVDLEGDSAFASLPDGTYTAAFRAHHLTPEVASDSAIGIKSKIAITEITGSESYIHVDAMGERWTSLMHGVHDFKIGDDVEMYVDIARCHIFDVDGNLALAGRVA